MAILHVDSGARFEGSASRDLTAKLVSKLRSSDVTLARPVFPLLTKPGSAQTSLMRASGQTAKEPFWQNLMP